MSGCYTLAHQGIERFVRCAGGGRRRGCSIPTPSLWRAFKGSSSIGPVRQVLYYGQRTTIAHEYSTSTVTTATSSGILKDSGHWHTLICREKYSRREFLIDSAEAPGQLNPQASGLTPSLSPMVLAKLRSPLQREPPAPVTFVSVLICLYVASADSALRRRH